MGFIQEIGDSFFFGLKETTLRVVSVDLDRSLCEQSLKCYVWSIICREFDMDFFQHVLSVGESSHYRLQVSKK